MTSIPGILTILASVYITFIDCTDIQAVKGLISINKEKRWSKLTSRRDNHFDMMTDNEFIVDGCVSELVLVLTCNL